MADDKFGKLDDSQVDELRNQLRNFVSGVKDPGALFLDPLYNAHSLHTNNHVKNSSPADPVDPVNQ